MAAAGSGAGSGAGGPKRGLLKPEPRLAWKGSPAPAAPARGGGAGPARSAVPAARQRVPGQPSNAVPLSQYTMDELRKMAASRGIPAEKLVAQLIAQYLAEGKDGSGA